MTRSRFLSLALALLAAVLFLTTACQSQTKAPSTETAAAVVTSATDFIPTSIPLPEETQDPLLVPDFSLEDQYGKVHTLSDYRGKIVLLNFWASWCGPCKQEMPHIQEAYENYGRNEGDVIILGVASPKTAENKMTYEGTLEDVKAFLTQGNYTYPSAMDLTGILFASYGVQSIPMTFMIGKDGKLFGYVAGTLTPARIEDMITQTLSGERRQ